MALGADDRRGLHHLAKERGAFLGNSLGDGLVGHVLGGEGLVAEDGVRRRPAEAGGEPGDDRRRVGQLRPAREERSGRRHRSRRRN
jgi:hypothetical protein